MALGVASDTEGFAAGWDWKGGYVNRLGDSNSDGLERFSQGSATPDTTLLFAGPARFSTVADDTARLVSMGLIDSFAYSANSPVQPLYEIGSNRTFFTRGKTQNQIQVSAMLADHKNLLRIFAEQSVSDGTSREGGWAVNTDGTKEPGADGSQMWLNLDSEAYAVPFGIMMVFKTKGQPGTNNLNGKILGATYLEYCMLTNFALNVQAQSPIIQENVGIMFDRAVPVAVN